MPELTAASFNNSAKLQGLALARIHWLITTRRHLLVLARQEARWSKTIPAPERVLGWRRSDATWDPTQLWWRDAEGWVVHDTGSDLLAKGRDIEPAAAGPTRADDKEVAWVAGQLELIPMVFGSVHLVPSVHLPLADALSEDQVAALVRWALAWMARGYHVVILGDFNFTPDHPNAVLLKAAGLRCINADDGPTHGKRTIDHAWVSAGVTEVWSTTVAGHRRDDHRILITRVRVTAAHNHQETPMARQARSLDQLLAEVNAFAPNRSKLSDGGLGDPAHAARTSDHNPNGRGVWRARDFTHDPAGGLDAGKLAEQLRQLGIAGHPALGPGAYVIWNWRIASATQDGAPWDWEPYSGSNGHTKHCHVSVSTAAGGYDSTKRWGIFDPETVWQPGYRDLFYRVGRPIMHGPDVRLVQRAIGMGDQDGYYGPVTAQKVALFERFHNTLGKSPKLVADGVVGRGTWRALGVTVKYGPVVAAARKAAAAAKARRR